MADADPVWRSRQARTKILNTLVEILRDTASDAGSTPAASTKLNLAHNSGVRISGWSVAALVVLAWFIAPLLLGGSTSAVELNSVPAAEGQPACEADHVFNARNWGGFETVRYDVWVFGCVDANRRLQPTTPPKCSAKSFLGPALANCSATQAGNRIRVNVEVSYPLGLGVIAGYPNPSTFYLYAGGYSAT